MLKMAVKQLCVCEAACYTLHPTWLKVPLTCIKLGSCCLLSQGLNILVAHPSSCWWDWLGSNPELQYTCNQSNGLPFMLFVRLFVKWFTLCYWTVVCTVLSVCNIGVLWPNGWMDQGSTWYVGRPWPRPHCVRWGPSPPPLTVKHILVECVNLRDICEKYFTVSSLADLFNRVDNHTVIGFIKETHFYHQL